MRILKHQNEGPPIKHTGTIPHIQSYFTEITNERQVYRYQYPHIGRSLKNIPKIITLYQIIA
jgi:hypothetical protein